MGTRNSSTEEVMQYHFFNEKKGEKEFVFSYVYTNVASVGAHPSYKINFKKKPKEFTETNAMGLFQNWNIC